MRTKPQDKPSSGAFTLAETVISLALTGIMVTGIVSGFLQSAKQAEWSAYSYAAQSQALWHLEQVRSAQWDPYHFPVIDEVQQSNFPVRVEILDVPTSGNNITYATNRTTITPISTTPPIRLIEVETTWRFINRGIFTNTVRTYRTTDQ